MACVAVVVVALIVVRARRREARTAVPETRETSAIEHEAAHEAAPQEPPPPAHVRKLASAADRMRVEQRIADARAARARAAGASSGTSPPQLPPATGGIESLPPKALDALKEAIPYLSECFGSDSPRNPIVQMTLEGDPDVGTLIDPGQMTDDKGAAISGPLADCLQTTLQSLELPPLAEGSTVRLQYSFRL